MASPPQPVAIPVFPLTGVLMLPGMPLPLHIFEQRYRNMIADAWEGGRVIGMVQPVVPRRDNRPDPDTPAQNPDLYAVGCLGRIAQCQRSEDGRYMIVLKGEHRFRITGELTLHRGYRRVEADYSEFSTDACETSHPLDSKPILEGFRNFAEAGGMKVDFQELEKIPAIELVNSLSMSLPFGPAEKQALLEAPDLSGRAALLLELMRINREGAPAPDDRPPTLN